MDRRTKITALTSVRFFAAFWVVLYHTFPREVVASDFAANLLSLGYCAVSLFFILSGFILAKVYAGLAGGAPMRRFWFARFARIYPAFLFSLLLDLPRLLLYRIAKFGLVKGAAASVGTLAFQAAVLPSWVTSQGNALNSPGWSIGVEAFFYASFPLLLPLARRLPGTRARLALLAAMWLLSIALALWMPGHAQPDAETTLWRLPLLRLPEFVAGIVLAGLVGIDQGERRAQSGPIRAALLLIALAGVCAIVWWAPALRNEHLAEMLLMPCFLIVLAEFALAESMIARLISGSLLVLLGEASYALYLLHVPVYWLYGQALSFEPQSYLPAYFGYVATIILASIALHLAFERPVRRWLMAWWDRRTERALCT